MNTKLEQLRDRLTAVRKDMASNNLDAFIVPRADEYLGEYVPEQNERLLWISAFSGSAGTVIILKDKAAIFVDGRYTIQVQQQAPGELFEYHHLVEEPPMDWLGTALNKGARVGMDTRLHSYANYLKSSATLKQSDIELVEMGSNPIDEHWTDRPDPEPQRRPGT